MHTVNQTAVRAVASGVLGVPQGRFKVLATGTGVSVSKSASK